jgi:hypothetical protein
MWIVRRLVWFLDPFQDPHVRVYGTAHHRKVQTQAYIHALSGSRVLGLSDGEVNDQTRLKPAELWFLLPRNISFCTANVYHTLSRSCGWPHAYGGHVHPRVGLFRFLGQQYCRETPIHSDGYENIFDNLVTVIKMVIELTGNLVQIVKEALLTCLNVLSFRINHWACGVVTVVLYCWETTFESWLRAILIEISRHPESSPSEKRGNRPLEKGSEWPFFPYICLRPWWPSLMLHFEKAVVNWLNQR